MFSENIPKVWNRERISSALALTPALHFAGMATGKSTKIRILCSLGMGALTIYTQVT